MEDQPTASNASSAPSRLTSATPAASAPPAPVVSNPNAILVSEKQRGNPLLRFVRLCPWEFSKEIIPDYVMGTTCAVFISLKFHMLHPKHVEMRIREVGKMYKLRILLALIDDDNITSVLNLNKICFANDFTFIAASSNEECGRYLETFKYFENRSSAAIQEKVETEFLPKLTRVLTSVRSVNKNDVQTLLDVFGTMGSICAAREQQLVLCPGLGEKKVKRLYRSLHTPFSENTKRKKVQHNSSSTNQVTGNSVRIADEAYAGQMTTDEPSTS